MKVYVVLTMPLNWTEWPGFIYRNFLGVYEERIEAQKLMERFKNFTHGDWRKISDLEWIEEKTRLMTLIVDTEKPQVFDLNH